MTRRALISAIVALLLVAPGDTVGGALAADPSDPGPTAEAQSAAPEAADDLPVAPTGEPSFFSWAYWQQGGGGASRSEIFRNFGLLIAAIVGLGFGIWRAWTAHRQANVAEQGNFTDRFSTAVEHLGSPELPVRLGGIHALWRLAKDSPKRDVTSVINILCAFVRNPPHASAGPPEPDAAEPGQAAGDDASSRKKFRPDVQTVLNLIGDREAEYRRHLSPRYRLNLKNADLTGANLWDANLTDANLEAANLSGADLGTASLKRACLSDAALGRAYLQYADLKRADLTGADLGGAQLWDADLTDVELTEANLGGANLTRVNLTGANLADANLAGANLWGAILAGAILVGASLEDATLRDADLTGADLTGADLTRANLRDADLRRSDLSAAKFEGAKNIPDLSLAYADPDNPPRGLPKSVKRPEPWEPYPDETAKEK